MKNLSSYLRKKIKNNKVKFSPNTNIFTVKSSTSKEAYEVLFSHALGKWICSCFWNATRTKPNKNKWGYCSHIYSCLYHYDKRAFLMELENG